MKLVVLVILVVLLAGPAALAAVDASADSATSAGEAGWSAGKVVRDLGSGLWLFVTDVGTVVTKPAHMSGQDYIWLGELFLYGGILFYYDEDITRSVQQNKDLPLLDAVGDVGTTFQKLGLMGYTNRFYLAGIVAGYVLGWGPLQRISTDILFSHWIAGLYRNAFKVLVGRARPNEGLGAYEFEFMGGGTSMPSGHASTVMQLATILSKYADWWPASLVFYAIAGSVCYQRVESREHWASDVWVGAMSGAAVARLVMREHDEKDVIWVPSVDPETGTVGVQLSWRF